MILPKGIVCFVLFQYCIHATAVKSTYVHIYKYVLDGARRGCCHGLNLLLQPCWCSRSSLRLCGTSFNRSWLLAGQRRKLFQSPPALAAPTQKALPRRFYPRAVAHTYIHETMADRALGGASPSTPRTTRVAPSPPDRSPAFPPRFIIRLRLYLSVPGRTITHNRGRWPRCASRR